MRSIIFGGKVVMAMHIVTMEHIGAAHKFQISLSNGLVLEEVYTNDEEMMDIARKLAFDGSTPAQS